MKNVDFPSDVLCHGEKDFSYEEHFLEKFTALNALVAKCHYLYDHLSDPQSFKTLLPSLEAHYYRYF